MYSRTSSAMKRKKLTTNSGLPVNCFRSSGSCVAMPTGQVFRWQTRIITQPDTTSGAVAKPNSSAPISAATTTSRPGLELAVHLHDDPVAQAVEHQHLLRLGEPQLPRHAAVFDGRERRGARAAVVSRNQHDVGVRLGHARRNRPDAGHRDELDVNPGLRVRVLQVVNELRQVFDRIDVVMRRRRDEADAGRRVPHLRDPGIHLVPGQLAALARLRALRHLDLQIGAVHQVLARDAEPRRRDLLDRAAPPVAVGVGHVARGIFAALAGVGLAAEPVHRDRQRLVRFLADRAVGHRAGREPLDDRLDRLDLVDRNGAGRPASVSSRPRSVARRRF